MRTKNIVLLHGWGSNVNKIKNIENELERLGWEVFSPKLPGFDADEPDQPWKLSDYADYVYRESKKRFTKFHVFGHSFGGRVAIKMAIKYPSLEGLILCATSGFSRGSALK